VAVEDIRIPDIGDAEDVEVVELCVSVGAQVEEDDALIVIESDKASMEVPSPVAGRIVRIDVAVGDKVIEGQVIAGVDVTTEGQAAGAKTVTERPAASEQTEKRSKPPPAQPSAARESSPLRTSKGRIEVRLPDVGDAEGIVVAEVSTKAGARVQVDDLLMVVESEKASMEIPAPAAGVVLDVAVQPGDEIAEGALLVVIETAESGTDSEPKLSAPAESIPVPQPAREEGAQEVRQPVPAQKPTTATSPAQRVYAGPAVRRLARELGVDLARVKGSGARGRIVKDDVQAFVKTTLTERTAAPGSAIPALPAIDFAKFGPVETVELSRIRRRGADNLHRSWLNVPHVTQHDEADVTELEAFRVSLKSEAAERGVKLTPLPLLMTAVARALEQFPHVNASLDSDVRHLIVKHYVHIGFAVDTPDGLIVPVVKDADTKGVFALATEIESLSEKARSGKLTPGDLSGGTFTISSLGAIGGTAFTPIVNAPEIAILGVSRLMVRPYWNGTAFVPRQFLPLSLSYDHRAINGADAGRFMTALCGLLTDIRRILL